MKIGRIGSWLGVLWALPITLPVLLLVWLLRVPWLSGGVRWARVRYGETTALAVWGGALDGLLRRLPLGIVDGMTLGHVVLFRNSWKMRWGMLFPFAYGLESLWQWLRGRHYYWDNRFEVAAYRMGRERFARLSKNIQ